jgi:hypothetical protein
MEVRGTGRLHDESGSMVSAAKEGADDAIDELVTEGAATANVLAPWYVEVFGSGDEVYSDSEWAEGAEYGIPDHPIDGGPPLANVHKPGRPDLTGKPYFYAKEGHVDHPGVRAWGFMQASMDELSAIMGEIVSRHMP